MVCIINFTFLCQECWKSDFWASKFPNFLGSMPPDPPRKGHSRTELNSHSRLLLYGQTPTSNLIESPAYVQICKIIYLTHKPSNLPPQLLPVRLQTYWTHSPELRLPLVTNRMQFYFCQSKYIVIESSVCLFPTGGEMQCKKVRRS